MKFNKHTLVIAFAMFSLFFGAGNLILPPFLGYNSGSGWFFVAVGFAVSAVAIPVLAIYAHARLQGTILDFATKVSPRFALLYSFLVYGVIVALPAPRTASVTFEIAFQPYFKTSSLLFSAVYFALVMVFSLNRTQLLELIGKFLTPIIIIILMCIIGIGVFAETETMRAPIFPNTFTAGILEGYQTFDAIGGIVVGGVIVISLGLQKKYNYAQKKQMIAHAGLLSGLGLFLIYGGLIAVGAFNSAALSIDNRTQLLIALSKNTLGSIGTTFLGVLVALACFTTAVGIITGTADFIKKIAGNSQTAFVVTVIVGCALGVAVGQFDVQYIIAIALPVLTLIYPITIVLIVLNCIPNKYATALVFRAVTIATLLFTLPDFLGFVLGGTTVGPLKNAIPLANEGLGWVLPAVVVFVVANLFFAKPEKSRPVA